MNTRATGLQAAENDLKQLMADVSRAMENAQEAIAKMACNTGAAAAETESTTWEPLGGACSHRRHLSGRPSKNLPSRVPSINATAYA